MRMAALRVSSPISLLHFQISQMIQWLWSVLPFPTALPVFLCLLPAPHSSSECVIPGQAGSHRCSGSDSLWAVPAPTRQLAVQGLHLCLPITRESKQFPLLSQDLRPLADIAEGKWGFGFNSGHKLSGLLPGAWGTEVTCGSSELCPCTRTTWGQLAN